MNALLRALATPFGAVWHAFPFTHDGRQTLIYLVFAGAGPALTALVWWAMRIAAAAQQWGPFSQLANIVAAALLVIVIGLAMFVSIRAVKIGPGGVEASGDPDRPATVTTTTKTEVSP